MPTSSKKNSRKGDYKWICVRAYYSNVSAKGSYFWEENIKIIKSDHCLGFNQISQPTTAAARRWWAGGGCP